MIEDIKKYRKISNTLYTAGQPTYAQFKSIKEASIDLVINLAFPDSPNAIPNEKNIVLAQTMDYIHIPVDFKNPKKSDLECFFKVMDENIEKKILIHCAFNWRVSCFTYLYRVIRQDCNGKMARQEMLDVWQPNETWESFISNCLINKSDFKNYQ
ncbi:MAG: phosphatase [Legionellales bacterium]|nr:phosphatase [Legionellales bacterium]